jgi:hypothetical protein
VSCRRPGIPAATDGPVARIWRSWDVLDYWLTQARSRIVDAVCGTEPEAAAVEAEAAAAGITDDLFRQDAAG